MAGTCDIITPGGIELTGESNFTGLVTLGSDSVTAGNVTLTGANSFGDDGVEITAAGEVTLNSAKVGNIFQRGNCLLTLASSPSVGLVGWEKPQDADGNHVWTVTDSTTFTTPNYLAQAINMTPGVVEELVPEYSQGKHSNIGTIGFALGFALMMVLDVVLG